MVRFIADMNEWNALMETSKSKAVIVDFTASWCKFSNRLGAFWLLDLDCTVYCYCLCLMWMRWFREIDAFLLIQKV